ncbi:MAG TPA: hypothetical protein DF613_12455, partial [Lachnospiraceae bacterium]|nr:hypothetical protein [Lachnospiraceae bacterium]
LIFLRKMAAFLCFAGSKVIFYHASMTNMTLGPAKHEKVAIFRRKMSGFRMFSGFREHKVRRNPCIIGVKIPFDPNIMTLLLFTP